MRQVSLPKCLQDLPRRFVDDLAFFYRIERRGLTKAQAERWERTARRLTGKEAALRAYFENELGCHEPLLSVATALRWVDADRARALDDYRARRVENAEERSERELLEARAEQKMARELAELFGEAREAEGLRERAEVAQRKVTSLGGLDATKRWLRDNPGVSDAPLDDLQRFEDLQERATRPHSYVEIPVSEAAKLLEKHEETILKLIRRGELAQGRRGYVRLNVADIKRFDLHWNKGGSLRAALSGAAELTDEEIAARVRARREKSPKKV